ncbi:hypothetical protein bpr_II036 (plasmid) [Butyrivibrio proteoclasticus B316]|uniref:Uncharacterized protein n=1 Tax=Butyrivibrio proteoclasticus (strain ATCC 51982 / DSM 14932 / B316) TaxID=515622 RepID=E0S3J4_BUTPB|nr:hypothetical protein [Butyrivibrio proteoclasticus]ADL35976.1 hypothetical protein bpr_II036 [Butyrivibrio proteoclasticus B316]
MEFKRVSVKDLVDVKKYQYGCKFEDSFLNSICDDIADYDVSYLWYKDSPHADKGYEFSITVRHKGTKLSTCGFIHGEPTGEKVTERIMRDVNGLKMHMAAPNHYSHEVGWKSEKDKRELYWL